MKTEFSFRGRITESLFVCSDLEKQKKMKNKKNGIQKCVRRHLLNSKKALGNIIFSQCLVDHRQEYTQVTGSGQNYELNDGNMQRISAESDSATKFTGLLQRNFPVFEGVNGEL
ncbi:hypothetical protein AVEN_209375-1 [Araneus ventricosus]|uniref:Uncharacterized protein n=1 Tax=Araneus ventricosus TaxID=182803 RepID=A0A4Y2N7V5_ARAVE|nr:hypothetical protein AVEN_209375-1 [Araneus ventricosus]